MIIEYDDSLYTGNEMIDTQHKELIEKISALVTSCKEGNGQRKAIDTLQYVSDYTDYHFREEEALMERSGYPAMEDHKKKHMEFRHSIDELFDFLEEAEGPSNKFVEQVKRNLVDWLFQHIKTFDRSVAENIRIRENEHLL